MTRRQLLLAGAALVGTAGCSSKDETPPDNAAPTQINPPQVGACGPGNSHNPEDWYDPGLCPDDYLTTPDGHDSSDFSLPLPAGGAKPRLNVHNLDATAKDHLAAAYDELSKDLSISPKSDISIGLQALIHNRYCSNPTWGVHRSTGGLFFAWHRAFLFFHERLIQWTLKNRCGVAAAAADNFRLPYWDPRQDFGVYGEMQRTSLFRMRGPTTADVPKLTVSDCGQTDLEMFGDRVLAWHGEVHNWLCGEFKETRSSGFDPLFYAYHAYVDFLWESSPVKGQTMLDQKPSTTQTETYWGVFFDATKQNLAAAAGKKKWSKVDLSQFGNPNQWGYFYSDGVMCDPNSPGLEFTNVELPDSDDQIFELMVRNLQNADDEKQIATIHPFGHVHKTYPFVRAYLTKEQVSEYSKEDRWGFWIRAMYQQKPVSVRVKAKPTPAPA